MRERFEHADQVQVVLSGVQQGAAEGSYSFRPALCFPLVAERRTAGSGQREVPKIEEVKGELVRLTFDLYLKRLPELSVTCCAAELICGRTIK